MMWDYSLARAAALVSDREPVPDAAGDNVQNLLEQAILAVPMFQLRWRWNATRSLLVARQKNGKKVPPALQRFRSDDLLTAVFPRLTGCQENITGDIFCPTIRWSSRRCMTA